MGYIKKTLQEWETRISRKIDSIKKENLIISDQVIIDDISTEIAPALSYIFNLSLETGVFPNCWKMSRTIPIHKKDKKDDLSNFRPIWINQRIF